MNVSVLVVLVAFLTIWTRVTTAQYQFNLDGNEYNFSFKTGDVGDHTREEARDTYGTVIGKYSYIDPFGHRREMRYRADENGFQPEGYAVSRPIVTARVHEVIEVEPESVDEAPQELEEISQAQIPTEETQAQPEVSTTQDITNETESATETEVVTTSTLVPSTTTQGLPTTLNETVTVSTNTTEIKELALEEDSVQTPSTQVVDENSIEEPSTDAQPQQLKGGLSLQAPAYPTLLRNPPIPELALPVTFYHPYRLFNSNIRPIPFIRQGNAGPITFF